MRFKLWYKFLPTYFFVQCFTINAVASEPQTYLKLTPKVCVVKKSGELCSMQINVKWQSPTSNDYCLFQDELALKCWLNSQQVNTSILISLKKNMLFTLRNNAQIVAQTTISVSATSPQQYRRKLRADWSVF